MKSELISFILGFVTCAFIAYRISRNNETGSLSAIPDDFSELFDRKLQLLEGCAYIAIMPSLERNIEDSIRTGISCEKLNVSVEPLRLGGRPLSIWCFDANAPRDAIVDTFTLYTRPKQK